LYTVNQICEVFAKVTKYHQEDKGYDISHLLAAFASVKKRPLINTYDNSSRFFNHWSNRHVCLLEAHLLL